MIDMMFSFFIRNKCFSNSSMYFKYLLFTAIL